MKKVLSSILGFLIIIFIILIYSRFVGVIGLDTNEINLSTNIVDSYDGLKIVHFSDIHYKKVITEKRVSELISEINRIKPDIVLFTGDMLDQDYKMKNTDVNFLIEELSKIETRYGSYAIMGDQDVDQEDTLKNIYIQSNFTLLKNETVLIHNENNDKILLTGLNRYLDKESNIEQALDPTLNTDDITYRIALIHEPDYIPTILKKYPNINLILSGHSIHGSIKVPLIKKLLLPKGSREYTKEEEHLDNTDIFVSNGIGVNNINFRLFNTPSINFYRIHRK